MTKLKLTLNPFFNTFALLFSFIKKKSVSSQVFFYYSFYSKDVSVFSFLITLLSFHTNILNDHAVIYQCDSDTNSKTIFVVN